MLQRKTKIFSGYPIYYPENKDVKIRNKPNCGHVFYENLIPANNNEIPKVNKV